MGDFDAANVLNPEKEDYITIEGIVGRIIFQNEENGYAVCEIETDEELAVVNGVMPFLSEGESISAVGKWTMHPSFGRQFKAEYYEKKLPSSKKSMIKYLSSGVVRNIGKVTAKRIVDQFGEDTFEVMENHPEWLADVKGITPAKAEEISRDFKNQFGQRQVISFCSGFFNVPTSVRIFKQYGPGAIETIKENPYALCDSVYGVNFEDADKLAGSLGQQKDSVERICAGLKYTLSYNANKNGHLFVPYENLIASAASLLKLDPKTVEESLEKLVAQRKFVTKQIRKKNAVYEILAYSAEKYCSQKLIELDAFGKYAKTDEQEVKLRLSSIEQSEHIKYTEEQTEAVLCALKSGVFVLTGGPGTGKTTIIKALIGVFSQMQKKMALAAPTGRAAKRMTQATGMDAKTIHRMLEMGYEDDKEPTFNKNEEDPLDFDVIIIDETSMVDIFLLKSLLKAIHSGTKLIFIGDSDQLPSVGPGNVLHDIIRSNIFSTIRLNTIFRQSGESLIVTNAHNINSGVMPILNSKDKDFFFIERSSPESIAKTVVDLCKNRLPATYGEEIAEKIQVMTPSKKGVTGTGSLNALLQSELNPAEFGKNEKKGISTCFREQDKVMQIRNNYAIEWTQKDGSSGIGIYNGDIGAITTIDNYNELVTIEFDDEKTVEYDFTALDEITHAFAITIHKSQGSEYPVVILPISREVPRLHTRNLLYTAVTRAQKMVILIGEPASIEYMVENNQHAVRYSGLSDILAEDKYSNMRGG
ncbi:MAG: ATP-dependent RecD-like DNA helicase [Oscillospiraceae bacterium]|nr:ATP-dependent RecD-like DNA helicase [Oscillospiraceae bacterium]